MEHVAALHRRALLALLAWSGTASVASTASAQEFDLQPEIGRVVETIGTQLAGPLPRLGLIDFAGRFRSARIRSAPLGYEKEETFRNISGEALNALIALVTSGREAVRLSQPTTDVVGNLSEAYRRNRETITRVFNEVRAAEVALRILTDQEIQRFQLIIALLLQQQASIWQAAAHATFVYPFC